MPESDVDLAALWAKGFSIAELWGASKPVKRGAADTPDDNHLIIWGILGIVEYQVDRGAGHKYLRARLWNGDWVAIGIMAPKTAASKLRVLPRIEDAQFGRKTSAVGDGVVNYVDVRIIHSHLYNRLSSARSGA